MTTGGHLSSYAGYWHCNKKGAVNILAGGAILVTYDAASYVSFLSPPRGTQNIFFQSNVIRV